ncbi:hypothetical protein [Bremerella cremea]|nr:hypothetical protein [Bremerella cremea]
MNSSPLASHVCQQCGGPGYGSFCSYRCWRINRGLPVEDLPGECFVADEQPAEAEPAAEEFCLACGGTAINSKGGPCRICERHGRYPKVQPPVIPPPPPIVHTEKPAAAGQMSLF